MPVSNRLQSTCSQCGLLLLLSCAAAFGAPIDHYTPDPDGVPIDFICAYREYAAEFAARLRPDFDQTIVFDALMLGSLCNKTYSDIARPASAEPAIVRENPRPADSTIYVAVSGDDSNPGTEAKPMKTVGAGLVASRKIPGPAKTLSVGPGTYYLTSTLTLTDKDEGLLITGTGKVWLSGAKPLPTALKWEQYKLGPTPEGGGTRVNIWKTVLPRRFHTLPQLRVNGGRSPRARHPNANPETDQWPFGYVSNAEWLPPKPVGKPTTINVGNAALAERGETIQLNYTGGIGGPCAVFDPPFSYWCSEHPKGGGGFQYFVPSGLVWPTGALPINASSGDTAAGGDSTATASGGALSHDSNNVSTNSTTASTAATGAVAHVWRQSHWANWMFEVEDIDAATSTLKFGKGGYQGCRGGNGSDWYLENVLELLDSANEHYYDAPTRTLYYQPNSTTGGPPASFSASAPQLMTLLMVNQTQQQPLKGLTIKGIGFRDTAPTYLEPHAVPSGGDWALERRGALFFEGTEGLTVESCELERLDGNGIMLSGYHRNATLRKNHIAWTGGTAFAGWGRTDEISDEGVHGYDASGGDFPWHTLLDGNVMRETGIWEKQSSCWFQAKTAQTTLRNNLCFNLARAGFNFNDGLGGGDQVYNNLIFNSCRESGDHGPINSWDRQPYVSTVATGEPSAKMLTRNLSYNFLVGNYGGGNGAIDNDDGSLHYDNNNNFEVYGHAKFKVGAIRFFGNVMAYVSDFGAKWEYPGKILATPNAMFDNHVIFAPNPNGDHRCLYHDCSPWHATNNTLYGPSPKIKCFSAPKGTPHSYTLEEWQALDPKTHDVGSKNVVAMPSGKEIVALARALLG